MDFSEQIKKILSQMTIEEKISQMSHDAKGIERLHIPSYNWWNEGLHGVGRSGTATVFPQAIALAAMFDREFLEKVGDAISDEFRGKYNEYQKMGDHGIYKGLTVWSPNINIFRDPRWGRGQETYGEDPFLTSRLGEAFINGLQGRDPKHRKTDATLKHFAVHSGPESERHVFQCDTSEKDLHETYLYAFKYCCRKADPSAVMGAYNAVNKEPCVASKTLIQKTLREEWGFRGYFVSDCGAVCDLYQHRNVAADRAEAAALAVAAGCDLCCGIAYQSLLVAVDRNMIREEELDRAVGRLLEARFHLGMNQSTVYDTISYDKVACAEHRALSLECAQRSIVLLKNNGILPLKKEGITISVCGPNADSVDVLLGNYNGTPLQDITFLEGIQNYYGESANVLYSEGCDMVKTESEIGEWSPKYNTEAVIHALRSDVVIACVGLSPRMEGEEGDAFNSDAGGDRRTLELPASQKELLAKLYATGKPVIVVNVSGSAVALQDEFEKADAILQVFYPGESGGTALARILSGEVSPSGKLPVTFYSNDLQLPDFRDYSMKNRTYRYFGGKPLFPFGYGLGYSEMQMSRTDIPGLDGTTNLLTSGITKEVFPVVVTVENKSQMPAEEVIQVYSRRNSDSGDTSPYYKLCGFQRVKVRAGERIDVTVTAEEAFSFFNEGGKEEIQTGEYDLFIGFSLPDETSCALTGRQPFRFRIRI